MRPNGPFILLSSSKVCFLTFCGVRGGRSWVVLRKREQDTSDLNLEMDVGGGMVGAGSTQVHRSCTKKVHCCESALRCKSHLFTPFFFAFFFCSCLREIAVVAMFSAFVFHTYALSLSLSPPLSET